MTVKEIPINTVKDVAGHKDAKMTLNVYGKTVVPDSQVRAGMEEALPDFADIAI